MVDIITRAGKGAPLTAAEIDGNFSNLKTDLEALQTAVNTGVKTISNIALNNDGDALIFTMSDDTQIGPLAIPVLTYRARGDWSMGAAYIIRDRVYVEGVGSFECIEPHTAGADFEADRFAGYWQTIAADGAPGEGGGGGGEPVEIPPQVVVAPFSITGGVGSKSALFCVPVDCVLDMDSPPIARVLTASGSGSWYASLEIHQLVVDGLIDNMLLPAFAFSSSETGKELPLVASYNLKRGDVIRLVVTGTVGAAADFSATFVLPVAVEEEA
jgi:hypothetical protein